VLGRLQRERVVWLFVAVYLLHLLGLINSSNMRNAGADIVLKLPLLLLPIIFATSGIRNSVFRWCLGALALSTIVGTVYCFIKVMSEGVTEMKEISYVFLASEVNLHPSIFSMYVGFAGLALGYLYFTSGRTRTWTLALLVLVWAWLSLNMILLSSRAGLITLALLLAISLAVLIRHGHYLLAAAIPLCMVTVLILYPRLFSTASVRVKTALGWQQVSSDKPQSIGVRQVLWQEAVRQIARHPLIGVGTGDVEDVLFEGVSRSTPVPATRERHAHNQFLQTTLALGLPGGLVLIASMTVPLVLSIRRRQWIYAVFLTCAGVFMLFDCPLEVQSGLIYFAVFNSLLFARMTGERQWASGVEKAVQVLRADGVILHNTDTVVGLACLARSQPALNKLFEIKHRPPQKPYVVLCSDLEMVKRFAAVPPELTPLVNLSLNVPITIIYDQVHGLPSSDDGTTAIRIPASKKLRGFLARVGEPLASTSANISGEVAPLALDQVAPVILNQVDYVLSDPIDDSPHSGQASMLLKREGTGWKVLRAGPRVEAIENLIRAST
jgi:L-threonylcarbamoyladenylate synthase